VILLLRAARLPQIKSVGLSASIYIHQIALNTIIHYLRQEHERKENL
jgi:DNA-directed RNA polymerase specialized sigma24 family protein